MKYGIYILFKKFNSSKMRKKSQKQKQPQNTTEPICETVNLLLTESKNSDNDTRVLLILQTKSFFQELLATATIDGDNTSLVNSAHLLFRVINESMQSFYKDKSLSDQLDLFISLFILELKFQDSGN